MNILVIDDQPAISAIIHDALRDDGIGVFSANSGQRGVELLSEHLHEITMIVLDYHMPDMNGWDTCAMLRELAPNIPIVPCTSSAEPLTLHELGCLPIMRKSELMNDRTRIRAAILHRMTMPIPAPPPPATLHRLTTLIRVEQEMQQRQAKAPTSEEARERSSKLEALVIADVASRATALSSLINTISGIRVALETTSYTDVVTWFDIPSAGTSVIVASPHDIKFVEAIIAAVNKPTPPPVLIIAPDFADALMVRDLEYVTALVIEHHNDAVVQVMVGYAVSAIHAGNSYRPPAVLNPCADDERFARIEMVRVLMVELTEAASIPAKAALLGLNEKSFRRVRSKLYDRLGIPPEPQFLRDWVNEWWRKSLPVAHG